MNSITFEYLKITTPDKICLLAVKETYAYSGANHTYYITAHLNHVACTCTVYKKNSNRIDNYICKHINSAFTHLMSWTKLKTRENKFKSMFYKIIMYFHYIETTKDVKQKVFTDEHCPICIETLDASDVNNPVIYCRAKCGQTMHNKCMQQWLETNNTCVVCRAEWINR